MNTAEFHGKTTLIGGRLAVLVHPFGRLFLIAVARFPLQRPRNVLLREWVKLNEKNTKNSIMRGYTLYNDYVIQNIEEIALNYVSISIHCITDDYYAF